MEDLEHVIVCFVLEDIYNTVLMHIIVNRGASRSLGLKKEVEEFALLFMVFDENKSW